MKYGYKEIRTLSSSDLRALCIAEDWYTGGTNEEYANLMRMTEKDNITSDDIIEIATDIIDHSSESIKRYVKCYGLSMTECYTHVMFLIAERCNTFFQEI